MSKAALIFVFNHKFERNIPIMAAHYGDRFHTIKYLMPFSTSRDPRVIKVIENGYTFSGHIAQGALAYCDPDITHYVFLGDDLILNPCLNQWNLVERLGLQSGIGYTKNLVPADTIRFHWPWSIRATRQLLDSGFNYAAELPDAVDAQKKFEAMGFSFDKPWPRTAADISWMLKTFPHRMFGDWLSNLWRVGRSSVYPLLTGYSDLVIVPAEHVAKFAHYCGVFSALNLFAEVGVPTALALACSSVKTELVLGSHFMDKPSKTAQDARMRGIEFWGSEIPQFAESLGYDWARLLRDFPSDVLYYHPVKLSMWK